HPHHFFFILHFAAADALAQRYFFHTAHILSCRLIFILRVNGFLHLSGNLITALRILRVGVLSVSVLQGGSIFIALLPVGFVVIAFLVLVILEVAGLSCLGLALDIDLVSGQAGRQT